MSFSERSTSCPVRLTVEEARATRCRHLEHARAARRMHSEALRGTQSQSEPIRANQSHSEPIRANQSSSEPIRANQSQSEPIRAHQSSSRANQSQSEPIRVHQSQSHFDHARAARPTGALRMIEGTDAIMSITNMCPMVKSVAPTGARSSVGTCESRSPSRRSSWSYLRREAIRCHQRSSRGNQLLVIPEEGGN